MFLPIQQNGPAVSDLKSNFISKKQSVYARIMPLLKTLVNKAFGEEITNTSILYKRRIALSLQTLRSLYDDNEGSFIFYLYSIKKDFCEEYNFIKNIKEYILCIKEKCDFVPLSIKNDRGIKKIRVYVSNNLKQNKSFFFFFFQSFAWRNMLSRGG